MISQGLVDKISDDYSGNYIPTAAISAWGKSLEVCGSHFITLTEEKAFGDRLSEWTLLMLLAFQAII